MRLSSAGFELLKVLEGFRAKPYVCAGGKVTIGYGHVVKPDELGKLVEVTQEQATALLEQEVQTFEEVVEDKVQHELKQREFDALVLFTYNVGAAALGTSTLLKVLNDGEWDKVPTEIRRWVYAGGRKNKGLANRREAEISLFQGRQK